MEYTSFSIPCKNKDVKIRFSEFFKSYKKKYGFTKEQLLEMMMKEFSKNHENNNKL